MLIGCGVVEQIKIELLRELVDSKVVQTATLLGQKGGYTVHVTIGGGERVLVNKGGQVRIFATSDACLNELSKVGLSKFSINTCGYEKALVRPRRHDVTARAKRVAEALQYDDWVRAQVQEAFDDEAAGLSDPKSHDSVWASLERAALAQAAERRPTYDVAPKRKAPSAKKD